MTALYRATNAIILGDRLAEKIGARIGANITLQTSEGARINAQVVGFFHSGVRQVDEGTAYVLIKTGQILSQQTGLINEFGMRLRDPMTAREVAAPDRAAKPATSRCRGRKRTRTCSRTFIIRNIIMYTVVGAILLVASFGTYNIISTITHEKARDIAIMKSLGLTECTVRSIFVIEAMMIGVRRRARRFRARLFVVPGARLDRDHQPISWTLTGCRSPTRTVHYLLAGLVALVSSVAAGYAGTQSGARASGRNHPGRDMKCSCNKKRPQRPQHL